MSLEPLTRQTNLEFVINKLGQALLLHKGPVLHDYLWIQYDSYTGTVQLIGEQGEIQELGMVVPEKVRTLLDKTREVSLLEIADDFSCTRREIKIFNKVVN